MRLRDEIVYRWEHPLEIPSFVRGGSVYGDKTQIVKGDVIKISDLMEFSLYACTFANLLEKYTEENGNEHYQEIAEIIFRKDETLFNTDVEDTPVRKIIRNLIERNLEPVICCVNMMLEQDKYNLGNLLLNKMMIGYKDDVQYNPRVGEIRQYIVENFNMDYLDNDIEVFVKSHGIDTLASSSVVGSALNIFLGILQKETQMFSRLPLLREQDYYKFSELPIEGCSNVSFLWSYYGKIFAFEPEKIQEMRDVKNSLSRISLENLDKVLENGGTCGRFIRGEVWTSIIQESSLENPEKMVGKILNHLLESEKANENLILLNSLLVCAVRRKKSLLNEVPLNCLSENLVKVEKINEDKSRVAFNSDVLCKILSLAKLEQGNVLEMLEETNMHRDGRGFILPKIEDMYQKIYEKKKAISQSEIEINSGFNQRGELLTKEDVQSAERVNMNQKYRLKSTLVEADSLIGDLMKNSLKDGIATNFNNEDLTYYVSKNPDSKVTYHMYEVQSKNVKALCNVLKGLPFLTDLELGTMMEKELLEVDMRDDLKKINSVSNSSVKLRKF